MEAGKPGRSLAWSRWGKGSVIQVREGQMGKDWLVHRSCTWALTGWQSQERLKDDSTTGIVGLCITGAHGHPKSCKCNHWEKNRRPWETRINEDWMSSIRKADVGDGQLILKYSWQVDDSVCYGLQPPRASSGEPSKAVLTAKMWHIILPTWI